MNDYEMINALSIKQPWTNLIADGKKTIETRTWKTPHRGPLLICSSKYPKIEPYGKALAVCILTDCRPMTQFDESKAHCKFEPDLFSWELSEIVKLKRPFDVTGLQGIYSLLTNAEIRSILKRYCIKT